jgi:hypothetical protein
MKVKEALQRLGFTISKQNKPNATDAEAFNKILWFVNTSIEDNPKKNMLFAKLYLYTYRVMYQLYGNDEVVQSKLHTILSQPIGFHYSNVKDTVNTYELRNYLDGKGIRSTYLEFLSKPERDIIEEQTKKNIENSDQKEILEMIEFYNDEDIVLAMNALITLALKTYTND